MLIRKTIITLTTLTVISAHADQIHVSAIGEPLIKCKVDHKCDIKGIHEIEIINDSNETHAYGYHYLKYAYNQGQRVGVNYQHRYINVAAHTTWRDHYEGFSKHVFPYSGSYIYVVETDTSYDGIHIGKAHNEYKIKVKD